MQLSLWKPVEYMHLRSLFVGVHKGYWLLVHAFHI
jgi:hypothetical protein